MSVKTPVFKFDTPVLGEEADVPADLAAVMLEVENVLKAFEPKFLKTAGVGDAKKLLIVDATGAPAFKAMSGDATIDEAGVITIGGEKISTAKLANLCVTEAKIALEAIGTGTLKNLGVTAGKLAALCVETGKIANLAVTAEKIANETITREKLAATARPFRWYEPLLIAGEEARTNVAYGTMPTPDQIAGVVVPAGGGKIVINYAANWANSKLNKGRAAIFLGANQLKIMSEVSNNAPVTQAAVGGAEGANNGNKLVTFQGGLISSNNAGTMVGATDLDGLGTIIGFGQFSAITPGVEHGGAVQEAPKGVYGGSVEIFAAPGTYTVSVQFKSAEGEVKAKNRRLMVGVAGNGS